MRVQLTRRAALTVAMLAGAVGAVVVWRQPLLPDSSWLLWVARRWLGGAALYRDIFEVNPPLAIWLHALPVYAAHAVALPVATTFSISVFVWCAGCLALMDRILRRQAPAIDPNAALAAAAIVILALPGPFFGQREHLLFAAALPWLALIAARRDGTPVSWPLAASAAFLVAVGIALKPTHVGLWLALPLVASRHGWWRWPETWVVPLVGGLYIGLVAAGTSYFGYLQRWGSLYWRFHHVSLLQAAMGNEMALLPLASCIISWHVARRRSITAALWAGTAATWVGAAAQLKGLPYHYWPADGLALLLLASCSRATRLALIPVATVWVYGVAALAWDGSSMMRKQLAQLQSAIGDATPLVLGTNNDSAWLLVNEGRHPWLSPHYCLWWLQLSQGAPSVSGLGQWKQQDSTLRASLLPATPPEVLLVEVDAIDVEAYLRRSVDWTRLLREYVPEGEVAGYRVLRRTGGRQRL